MKPTQTKTHTSADVSRRGFLRASATTGAILGSGFLSNSVSAQEGTKAPQSPSGLKASLAAYSFRQYLPKQDRVPAELTLHRLFDWVAEQGLGAVEPTSYYFSAEDPEYLHSLKARAFKLGLDISGTAIRNNFTHVDKAERDKWKAHVKTWVDHSVKIGAPVIRIFAGNQHKDVSDEQALAWTIDYIKECCDYAGEHGVFLAIENHGYLTGTSADLMKIVEGVNHPCLGVNLDTGNFTEDPYGNIERMVPHAVNVQLKTEVIAASGKGREEADIDRIIGLLNAGGYRGYVALEYEGKTDPYEAVPGHLRTLKKAIRQSKRRGKQ